MGWRDGRIHFPNFGQNAEGLPAHAMSARLLIMRRVQDQTARRAEHAAGAAAQQAAGQLIAIAAAGLRGVE